jgi:hypothetical protein
MQPREPAALVVERHDDRQAFARSRAAVGAQIGNVGTQCHLAYPKDGTARRPLKDMAMLSRTRHPLQQGKNA